MKELLECDDLRRHKRVIKAYWGLIGKEKGYNHNIHPEVRAPVPIFGQCTKCGKKEIVLNECHRATVWYGSNHSTTCWILEGCTKPDPIPGSLADIAFEMRDAICAKEICHLHKGGWRDHLYQQLKGMDDSMLIGSDPEHWIIAATLAWEATQK